MEEECVGILRFVPWYRDWFSLCDPSWNATQAIGDGNLWLEHSDDEVESSCLGCISCLIDETMTNLSAGVQVASIWLK